MGRLFKRIVGNSLPNARGYLEQRAVFFDIVIIDDTVYKIKEEHIWFYGGGYGCESPA
jgi:hypothetical protein